MIIYALLEIIDKKLIISTNSQNGVLQLYEVKNNKLFLCSTIQTDNQIYIQLIFSPDNRLIGVDLNLIHIFSTINGFKILSAIETDFIIYYANFFSAEQLAGS